MFAPDKEEKEEEDVIYLHLRRRPRMIYEYIRNHIDPVRQSVIQTDRQSG